MKYRFGISNVFGDIIRYVETSIWNDDGGRSLLSRLIMWEQVGFQERFKTLHKSEKL